MPERRNDRIGASSIHLELQMTKTGVAALVGLRDDKTALTLRRERLVKSGRLTDRQGQ